MTKYEMIVVIDARDASRGMRQSLVNGIDMALCAGSARITEGAYEVVIRRLTKKEIEDMKTDEDTLRRAGEGM